MPSMRPSCWRWSWPARPSRTSPCSAAPPPPRSCCSSSPGSSPICESPEHQRAKDQDMIAISVIVGSTRQRRFSEKPAQWILEHLRKRDGLEARLLDLRNFPMPFFDQAVSPATPGRAPYEHEVVTRWTAAIAASDGFVFVTPEYNYGPSAVLKNALDWVYPEWNRKAAAFVSYGSAMGARSVQQLRETAIELQIAPVRSSVHIPASQPLRMLRREPITCRCTLPLLPDGASIILNASIVASKGLPEWSVYSATKAAVRSFARTWATDLKARRIRVNAVSPGHTDTPPWRSVEGADQLMKNISTSIPLGRFGTPDEIAQAVLFLASDDSSYITGTELFVDGGFAQV